MEFEKKFNGYIGFSPVSLFITLEDKDYELATLNYWWNLIESQGSKDIIFQGTVIRNLDFLQWLATKMVAESYYISMILDDKELLNLKQTIVYAHRIILKMNGIDGKRLKDLLEQLGEHDILILNTEKVNILGYVNQTMKQLDCKANLYFNNELLNESEVLESGITSAYPFGGVNAPKESTDEIGTADRTRLHKEKS